MIFEDQKFNSRILPYIFSNYANAIWEFASWTIIQLESICTIKILHLQNFI